MWWYVLIAAVVLAGLFLFLRWLLWRDMILDEDGKEIRYAGD